MSLASRPQLSRVGPNSALGRHRGFELFIKRLSMKRLFMRRLATNQLSLAGLDTPAAVALPTADEPRTNFKAFVPSLSTDLDDIPVLLESPNV